MALRGLSFIGSDRGTEGDRTFRAENPATCQSLEPPYHAATMDEVDRACRLASQAFETYGIAPGSERGALLRAIADGLEARAGEIVARAGVESGLPEGRLKGELGRTTSQLRLFAGVAEDGSWADARIERGDPDRKPAPKPDLRSMRVPLGPVVVFGASNFPLAFSVAGGDTASALAAGNPVIVKAHPAHPGASELAGEAIVEAVHRRGLAEGTFSLLFDDAFAVGERLVQHPLVRAVGFTGSRSGGEALMRLAAVRRDPIPVYAEMGSVNPVLVLPGALRQRGAALAEGLHASFTLGVGQYCTNPGVVLVEAGPAGDAFVGALVDRTEATPAGTMLTSRIWRAYEGGLDRLKALGATRLARGAPGDGDASGQASLWQVDGAGALKEPALLQEVFGPSTLLVRYADARELLAIVRSLEGQLTATILAGPGEAAANAALVRLLATKAGRLVFDQFPTGVEVNAAMVHGGPFPATSDGRSTSVGTRAIDRFSRLVAYQNAPNDLLPVELRSPATGDDRRD